MLSQALLLLLPALAYARISINLNVGTDESKANVEILGSNVEIIPEGERGTWKLSDSDLKDAAKALSGGRPSDVYLKSPTPWGDLYRTYGWQQVQRTLYPRNAMILGIRSEPVIISTKEFINNSSVKAVFNAGISQQVAQTVSNSWSKGGQLQIGQEITYKVEFGAGEVGGKTAISYTSSWGLATSKSHSFTVGSSSGVQVELEPGQEIIATLSATRGTMEVLVDYRATLDGFVASNYAERFKGHHFWAYDVNSCLSAAGWPRTIDSTEKIKIGFYSEARIMISDKKSAQKLKEVKAEFF